MLHTLDIRQAHDGLVKKEFTAVALVEACLAQIDERQAEINAFITIDHEGARQQAQAVDEKIARGEEIGMLEGIPMAIKDNILVAGMRLTAGSRILGEYTASYDATVIERLRAAGAIILGKTNLDEFAMGSSSESSAYGVTRNPHNLECVPGGSSGGSAAAVADQQALCALGSDTGGSIRQPAGLCGIVGLKPTYGRVSRYGAVAMASSFDQIGPMTKTVDDAAILFDVLHGNDAHDNTTVDRGQEESFAHVDANIAGKRIGYIPSMMVEGMDPEIKARTEKTLKDLEKAGAELVEIELPHAKYALAAYYLIMPAEVSANLARFDGIRYGHREEATALNELYKKNRALGFGKEVKRRIMLGTYALSAGYYDAYYKKAQKLRELIMQDFNEAFKQVDCLVTPTTPNTAFKIGALIDDPLTMYLEDIFTVAANIAGVPAMSVPNGLSTQGLPIGIQVWARHFDERTVLSVGKAIESLEK